MAFCQIYSETWNLLKSDEYKQEAQGIGALFDKMEDNDHIKLDKIEI